MANTVYSCSINGLESQIIEVEAAITNGLPYFNIIGLADRSVQESKERIRLSIKNSDFKFPAQRKTINLAPTEIKKHGANLDLSIAIALLIESKQIQRVNLDDSIFIGELGLDGKLKPINGVIAIAQHIAEQGFKKLFLPEENAKEASFINNIEIYPINSLKQILGFLNKKTKIKQRSKYNLDREFTNVQKLSPFYISQIAGLKREKRALSIAATGGHNILLKGPPGSGKTLLARAVVELLPKMTKEEILESSKIFSISGLVNHDFPLIIKRPFREVHNGSTLKSIIGGGPNPKPGEISLAHNGVLFFDEISEFSKAILEAMRQPLENKFIQINRVHKSLKYPSNFLFIGTMNPCPCGYNNNEKVKCICSTWQIKNYQKKLSGAILDRFDIFLDVDNIKFNDFYENQDLREYENLIKKINNAYNIQINRFKNNPLIKRNRDMQLKDIKNYCKFTNTGYKLLKQAHQKLNLSNRGYLNAIKLAQTIGDLEESEKIKSTHIAEAMQYRTKNDNLL